MNDEREHPDEEKKKEAHPDFDELQEQLKSLFDKLGEGNMKMVFPSGDVVSPQKQEENVEKESIDTIEDVLKFDMKPRQVKAHLDRYVIRQDEAKKALAIAVCDHYNHAREMRSAKDAPSEYQKQNVIITGPTGVGKTYLVKHIAELIGVPFVKADATKFSETGYVGGDVDDLVRELVRKADGDVELAEYGIIYIDEIDKIASRSNGVGGKDVSGRGVQTTLLKLMEETDVSASNPMDMKGQMMQMMRLEQGGKPRKETINTRHILFIVSGAFSGMEKIIEKRVRSGQIGFQAQVAEAEETPDLFSLAETQDYLEYGFEAEFIGRLPVRVFCEKLEKKDFVNIMRYSEGSILRQYEDEFEAYGIRAKFEDSAIEYVAELAEKENTGARALMTVLAGQLRDFKFELPGTNASELLINVETLQNKDEVLAEYRVNDLKESLVEVRGELEFFCREFESNEGLSMVFSEEAIGALSLLASEQGRSVMKVCKSLFKDYAYGLNLVRKNTTQSTFELPKAAIDDADGYLNELVLQSYKQSRQSTD